VTGQKQINKKIDNRRNVKKQRQKIVKFFLKKFHTPNPPENVQLQIEAKPPNRTGSRKLIATKF